MKDGQMNTNIPRWHGLKEINSILTGTLNNIDDLNNNYPSIEGIQSDNADSYIADLNGFRNKYINN